ncbi:response regulator transcription factor [Thomasclavelia spiroformis]|uniref:DNA-binding response regulator n=1 Tax=Thomasclavelia spiroformis TaxID=29348 RepID=A0A1Y4QDB4_9FIRM|nr:response regulator transcription factor [Thomasclavelia spiroformis]MBS6684214.1 response regulator transcription factor [Thomasclavelia spiroformis]OUO71229.1 DNA-binding response regulator [Thomasclavelia spiroformis]OUQ03255.1 DNA-binding response regulator [Thomasclavelia spiroformis]OUQ04566.1 DNA-binding response regulator [Thomasclavelia spiroformis]
MNNYKILIVDDDKEIRIALKEILEKQQYVVVEASNGDEAISKINNDIDLIILDVMMPNRDGITTCIEIRENYDMPILFLTAKSTEYDKYIGLSMGGDDYLSKPFSKMELLARVSSLIRRYRVYQNKQNKNSPLENNYIYIKDLRIDKYASRVYKNNQEITLTNIEYKILMLLAQHKNKIFTLENLYESIWHESYDYSVNQTIMVHIRNLRKKLDDSSKSSQYIKNVWGRGYCIEEDE